MEFIRIKNDVNGNPRYVCHFLNIDQNYETAIKKAKTIGGKKYHTKSYGGGIVFGSVFNIADLKNKVKQL